MVVRKSREGFIRKTSGDLRSTNCCEFRFDSLRLLGRADVRVGVDDSPSTFGILDVLNANRNLPTDNL